MDFSGVFRLPGRVEWIGYSRAKRATIEVVDEAVLVAGLGIDGDHHRKRQLTLLQSEYLPVIAKLLGREAVDPVLLRRNLVVSGMNLRALQGRYFQIGEAVVEGIEDCRPCPRMEENLGTGGYNALMGHGGLVVRIIEGATIRVGDRVQALDRPSDQALMETQETEHAQARS